MKRTVVVVLHNIRSSHNVGSIFRTCDGAGVSRVVLVGYTPLPVDRFGRVNKDIAKTALGAEKEVEWEYVKDISRALKKLRSNGYRVVGVEQDPHAKALSQFKRKTHTAFVFGNEVRGLSKAVRDSVDELVAIPMYGKKESLNVSVATGIVLYHGRT